MIFRSPCGAIGISSTPNAFNRARKHFHIAVTASFLIRVLYHPIKFNNNALNRLLNPASCNLYKEDAF